ncbi:MAG: DUF2252 family protein, partial [Glaciecola sp.]
MTSRADFINQQLLLIDGQYAAKDCPKHVKMCTSPFVFFRGSSQLFYADLAVHNIAIPKAFDKVPLTTVMGDCHTSNFGFFTEEGSHGENIVFSINDFDDACIGHAYWDILRYCVSLALAVDHCEGIKLGTYASDKDYSQKPVVAQSDIVPAMQAFIQQYCDVLLQGIERKPTDDHFLDETYHDFNTPSVLKKRYKKATQVALGGSLFTSKSALAKAIDLSEWPLKFATNPVKFTYQDVPTDIINTRISPYFYDHVLDAVKRENSGTGSVNMQRYYLLIGPEEARHEQMPAADELSTLLNLCHVVEVKQQRTAAPIHYFSDLHHQNQLNAAHLTVKCQRKMQRRQDYCLDDIYFNEAHWLIRSRHHAKVGVDSEHIGFGRVNALEGGFAHYAYACGQELARAHCRG